MKDDYQQLAIEKATNEIDEVLASCKITTLQELPALRQAVVLAAGVQQLRAALTDDVMQRVFMPLSGLRLGFLTDLDKGTEKNRNLRYGIATVRDCLIEGMLRGLQPINNEINIIANSCYSAKNGFARLIREYPGLTDLDVIPGVPHSVGDRGALVPMTATWKIHGQAFSMVRDIVKDEQTGVTRDLRVPVISNKFMGPDAIVGKATRKIYKAIYDRLTGSTLSHEDGDIIDTHGTVVQADAPAPATPEQDGTRVALKGKRKAGAKPEETEPKGGGSMDCVARSNTEVQLPPPVPPEASEEFDPDDDGRAS